MTSDPYSVLGLEPGASDEVVEQRYRRLVRRFPPELSPRRFAAIQSAHEQLRSLERRMRTAMSDVNSAIGQLFPKVEVHLTPEPPPPPPPSAEEWASFLAPLRERALTEVLATLAVDLQSDQPGGSGTASVPPTTRSRPG